MTNGEPINGAPKLPSMTPDERALWLASKGAPEEMMLVTTAEWGRVMRALKAEHAVRTGHEAGIGLLIMILGEYYKTEPDLRNAVGAVVFDAERFKKCVDLALPNLRAMLDKLDKAIVRVNTNPISANIDLLDVSSRLGEVIKLMSDAKDMRRDRGKTQTLGG